MYRSELVSIKWTLESEISKKDIHNSAQRYKSNKMYIYAENCKTEVEEVKYRKREREIRCLWIRGINIFKSSILSNM